MSYCGVLFVFFFVSSLLTLGLEWPKWIFVILTLASGVFEMAAINQYDKMRERVDKLERELKQRGDGDGE